MVSRKTECSHLPVLRLQPFSTSREKFPERLRIIGRYFLMLIIGFLVTFACNPDQKKAIVREPSLWAQRTHYKWTHDGKPLYTEHFAIFTDAASKTEKEKLARGLEIFLDRLAERLEIIPDSVDWYPTRENPFVVYMNRTHEQPRGGHAFPGGFIIVSPDAPFFENPYPGHYGEVVRHELAHVLDMAMLSSALEDPPRWFREGFAHFMSGPRLSDVQGSEGLYERVRDLGYHPPEWTPLSIMRHEDYPPDIRAQFQVGRYYDLFEVSVRYIDHRIREKGLGQIRSMYDLMGQGMFFDSALMAATGFGMETLERHFYEWIGRWLDEPLK